MSVKENIVEERKEQLNSVIEEYAKGILAEKSENLYEADGGYLRSLESYVRLLKDIVVDQQELKATLEYLIEVVEEG